MGVSWIVAVSFGTAVAAQLMLGSWLARIYATIPSRIPYGKIGEQYFWYGRRAIVWIAPLSWLLILAFLGRVILQAPSYVRTQPLLALPFVIMAVTTPLVALSINGTIEAGRRRGRSA